MNEFAIGGSGMKIDMHYFGTYALARAAGIEPRSAKIIATAAQYVDDCVEDWMYICSDGSCILVEATGHHSANIQNLFARDQRTIWVPFHFLPGNQGKEFPDRIQCSRADDKNLVARAVIESTLAQADEPFGREMIGVVAHVYADTFTHHGFSGISSDRNRVIQDTLELNVRDHKVEKYIEDKSAYGVEGYPSRA